jgi:hypothetical protein
LDAAWGKTGLRMALQSKIFLDLSMGATRLGGVVSKMKGEPKAELELLPGDATRVLLHVRSARTLPLFQETQGVAAYTVPLSGFASPGFIQGEVGGDVDRRLMERILFSVGARVWEEDSRSQWTESALAIGRPIWETVALLRCWEARVGLKADFGHDFALQVDGRLSEAKNRSGDGRLVTGWPRHQGVATFSRKTAKDYMGLTIKGVSSREADSSIFETLAPYWTLSLEARRALGNHWTVWAKGDNLNGQKYELLPGYPEPRFLVRAGLEVVF